MSRVDDLVLNNFTHVHFVLYRCCFVIVAFVVVVSFVVAQAGVVVVLVVVVVVMCDRDEELESLREAFIVYTWLY